VKSFRSNFSEKALFIYIRIFNKYMICSTHWRYIMQETMEMLRQKLTEQHYIYDDELIVTLAVALKLGRPLLIEGAAGVGKTEVAKVMATALNRELIRLQCHEGMDESKALYEWNYQKQLLAIQIGMNSSCATDTVTSALFGEEFLLERPLLRSIRSKDPVVLLIDEIDKSDEEFEAFLLEILSDMQVSIPELGTVRATTTPFVVLTSNNARPLSEALKRRCAYLYITYPSIEKEVSIIHARLPQIGERLANPVAAAVSLIRSNSKILKKPSIAETLDWAAALDALGANTLDKEAAKSTLGFILKNNNDIEEIIKDDRFVQSLD
jgi:MoxR-like ATPase